MKRFVFLRGIAFCIIATLVAAAPVLASTWALIVGISDYQEASFSRLRYATTDAQELAAILEGAGQVPAPQIFLLVDEKATLANIERALSDIAARSRPQDTVVIFFSGHGAYVTDTDDDEGVGDRWDEALVPYDGVPQRAETLLVDDLLGYRVRRLPVRSTVVLLDACYSGGEGSNLDVGADVPATDIGTAPNDIFSNADTDTNIVLLAACNSEQKAFENEEYQHGVFTHFLLSGLEGSADANADTAITTAEIGAYIQEEMAGECSAGHPCQRAECINPSLLSVTLIPPRTSVGTPSLYVTPSEISLRTGDTQAEITVRNTGGEVLSYWAESDKTWCRVDSSVRSVSGEADTLTVSVEDSNLPQGIHVAHLRIRTTSGQEATILVSLDLSPDIQVSSCCEEIKWIQHSIEARGNLGVLDETLQWGLRAITVLAAVAALLAPDETPRNLAKTGLWISVQSLLLLQSLSMLTTTNDLNSALQDASISKDGEATCEEALRQMAAREKNAKLLAGATGIAAGIAAIPVLSFMAPWHYIIATAETLAGLTTIFDHTILGDAVQRCSPIAGEAQENTTAK